MTIALILAGHKYKVMPASAGFPYVNDGHALSIGETFTASQGSMANDSLKLGMTRAHIVELFDELTVAERDARMTELRAAMGQYASAHCPQQAAVRLVYDAAQTKELDADDDVLYGIVITQPFIKFTPVTVLAGTTLNNTAPAKFQAVQNGVNTGARVAATGSTPFDISRSGMTGIVSGDVLGFYAVNDTTGSRLSDTTNKTAIYEAPAITGTPTQDASSVTGTSTAPNGAIVTVYQNSTAIKTATVAGGAGAWTASSIASGVIIGTGSLTAIVGAGFPQNSASSAAVIAKFNAGVVAAIAPAAHVTGTSDAPDGTLVTVFKQSLGIGSFNAITPTGTVTSGAFNITPAVALAATDVIKVKIGSGSAQSAFSNAITVT